MKDGPRMVTVSEYARHRGVSRQSVYRAARTGRISWRPGHGLLDLERSDAEWSRRTRTRVAVGPKATNLAPERVADARRTLAGSLLRFLRECEAADGRPDLEAVVLALGSADEVAASSMHLDLLASAAHRVLDCIARAHTEGSSEAFGQLDEAQAALLLPLSIALEFEEAAGACVGR